MKLSTMAFGFLLAGSIAALGQQPGRIDPESPPQGADAGTEPGSRVAPMSNEQRQRIRAFVVEQRVPPVTISTSLAVGTTIPAEVELHPVPPALSADIPSIRTYRYVYWNDRVVLVEPSSRRVVQIIE